MTDNKLELGTLKIRPRVKKLQKRTVVVDWPQPVKVQFRLLDHAVGMPERASKGSVGYDIRAAIQGLLYLHPEQRTVIPTGIVLGLPKGYEAQVRSRSGLSAKEGLTVLNSPGTIDSDYRGEVKVILINHDPVSVVKIERGDRIAQIVVMPVPEVLFEINNSLGDYKVAGRRNDGGFGSTGRK